jgi:hypothetical protein
MFNVWWNIKNKIEFGIVESETKNLQLHCILGIMLLFFAECRFGLHI